MPELGTASVIQPIAPMNGEMKLGAMMPISSTRDSGSARRAITHASAPPISVASAPA